MTKSNQSSLDIADHLSRGEYDWCPEAETRLREQHDRIKELEANPTKELTDEEIIACTSCLPRYNSEIVDEDLVKFAIAVLRKSQEK